MWASLSPQVHPLCHGLCALDSHFWRPTFCVTDLCALVSASQAHTSHRRACVHLFQLTRSSFYVLEIVCIRFGSLGSPSMLQGLCVLLSSLNLLFAPQGLCVLQSFVCRASLDTLASPLHQGTSVGFLWFPEPAVLSGP